MELSYCIVFDLNSTKSDPWCKSVISSGNIFQSKDLNESSSNVTEPSLPNYSRASGSSTYQLEATSRDHRQSDIEIFALDMSGITSATNLGPLKSSYMGNGVVRLFRDFNDTKDQRNSDESEQKIENDDKTVVAILAVPSYFSPSDILGFVGPKAQQHVSHFRMIRTASANRYMVLIKFRDQENAKWFMDEYNGKLFNSMEAETCQVVPISSVRFRSHVKQEDDDIPYLLEDTFTATTSGGGAPASLSSALENRRPSTSRSSRPDPPPPSSLRELPTCPVCLERMDTNVTGLLTILCQHTFHCQCLSKWGDGSCPVCRYTQQGKSEEPAYCSVCKSTANPWVCLVCGHVGCGRYDSAHAFQHYEQSGHCYSMDVGTQRVWDYATDAYVHRLLQNPEGKLVETGGDKQKQQKDDEDIAMQYTHLLTSQLESQRSYYEDMMANAADKASEALSRAEQMDKTMSDMQQELEKLRLHDEEVKKKEHSLTQQAENSKIRADSLQSMYTKLSQSYKDEKAMSEKMVTRLDEVTKTRDELKAQVDDLQSQVTDLMFYLDAQNKLKDAGEDVQQGQIVTKQKKKGKKK